MKLPQSNEIGAIADRAKKIGGSIEETERGVLLRDPFQNGVLLTAS